MTQVSVRATELQPVSRSASSGQRFAMTHLHQSRGTARTRADQSDGLAAGRNLGGRRRVAGWRQLTDKLNVGLAGVAQRASVEEEVTADRGQRVTGPSQLLVISPGHHVDRRAGEQIPDVGTGLPWVERDRHGTNGLDGEIKREPLRSRVADYDHGAARR